MGEIAVLILLVLLFSGTMVSCEAAAVRLYAGSFRLFGVIKRRCAEEEEEEEEEEGRSWEWLHELASSFCRKRNQNITGIQSA